MSHRALEILRAIEAAIPGSLLQPGWKPDQTSTVITMAALTPEGDPAPNTFSSAIWRLQVAVDLYVYELETDWLDTVFAMLVTAHKAIMNDGPGGTYDALPYVQSAWLSETEEPDIDTTTERSHAYLRAEFFVDYRSSPGDPEN